MPFSVDFEKEEHELTALANINPPGAATEVACAKLKNLKEKFVRQLATSRESYSGYVDEYKWKICEEEIGCERDEAKRMEYQRDWQQIEDHFEGEHTRLEDLLARIENIIEETPFRYCDEFEGYLSSKRQLERGRELLGGNPAEPA